MKKIMMMLGTLVCLCAGATTYNYQFNSTIRFPYVSNGIRTYSASTFKGTMAMSYDEEGVLANVSLNIQNTKTKAWHKLDFTESFYHLIGKSNKNVSHQIPTVAFVFNGDDEVTPGTERNAQEPHETIVSLGLAGDGTLKYQKTVIKGCGSCGLPVNMTEYCSILNRLTGTLVGVMDCVCPDEEGWDHTVIAGPCGPRKPATVDDDSDILDYLDEVRSHYASIRGTWTATFKSVTED